MWDWLANMLNNVWFWVVLIGFGTIFYGVYRGLFRRIPFFRTLNRGTLFMIGIIGMLVVSGIFGSFSMGTLTKTEKGSYITDFQVTTATVSDCTSYAESTTMDDVIELKCTDAQATDEDLGVFNTTIITVTRSGDLDAESFPVRIVTEPYQSKTTPGAGTEYTIIDQNAKGELLAYVEPTASTSATSTSPKEYTQLAFDEGVATATLGVSFSIDETAHDNLNSYDVVPVYLWVGDKVFTLNVHRWA